MRQCVIVALTGSEGIRMDKQIILLAILAMACSSTGQEAAVTNGGPLTVTTNSFSQTNAVKPSREGKNKSEYSKGRRSGEGRRLQLMERELDRIGVTEEERTQIMALQQAYKEKMSTAAQEIEAARERLTQLLDEGAPMEMLEAAIEKVSAAQTAQLRVLVMNRIEMERILGKEKHDEFMKNARKQYHKHGRRGGPPLPPRPGPPAPPQAPPEPGS